MRWLSLSLLIGLSWQAWSQEGPNPPFVPKSETKKVQTGSVSGQVLYSDTGKPVRHGRILFMPEEEGGSAAFAVSDREGNFLAKKLSEGSYIVDVESPGCVSMLNFYDVSDFKRHDGANIDTSKLKGDFVEARVDAGQETKITAFCKRGGAIAGAVTYEDGSPAPNVHVNLFRKSDSGIQQVISGFNVAAMAGNQTDDRGRFRIAGLLAGEYVLAASEDSLQGSMPEAGTGAVFGMEGSSLAQIFYGDVPTIKEAKSIKLALGEERDDADIHLVSHKLHSISGTLLAKSDQHPVAQANIALMVANAESPQGSALSVTDEDGRWSFDGIPDGQYTITVNPGFEVLELQDKTRHPDSLKSYAAISRDITVQGKDMEGIKLEVKEDEKKKSKSDGAEADDSSNSDDPH